MPNFKTLAFADGNRHTLSHNKAYPEIAERLQNNITHLYLETQMIRIFKLILATTLLPILQSCTTIHYYVVRHADRMGTHDALKIPEGTDRAEALAQRLRGKGIRNIFSTNFQRTRLTAKPLSDLIGVPVTIYNETIPVFRAYLRTKSTSLVVGHSDTILDIVRGLGAHTDIDSIRHNEFDRLFIVQRRKILWGNWHASVTAERYGAVAH